MSNFIRKRIDEIAEVTKLAGFEFTKFIEYIPNGEIIAIRALNLKNGQLVLDDVRRIDRAVSDSLPRSRLYKNDIVISYTGTVGEAAQIEENNRFHLAPNVAKITPLKDKVNPQYLFYYIRSYEFKQQMLNYAHGSTQMTVPMKVIRELSVPIPPRIEQERIVSILEPIYKKIKENEQINNNLAEQSQAILKRYMDSCDYTLTPLGELAEIIDCLHSKKPNSVNDTTKQLLQLNNITDSGFLDLSTKYYISESDYENWTRKCEIVEGDCVITNVGRIGAVSQAPLGTHAAMGRNMTCIRLKKNKPYYSYLITVLLSNHISKEIMKNTDEGTIMGALNVKNIPLLLFPVFSNVIMRELENTLHPIRKAIEYNYLANQTMGNLRDSLLPKLMSGELDVSNIEL